MVLPQHSLVDIEATAYYHCVVRCVRHAFLRGRDPFTGKSVDSRAGWIVERLAVLTEIFCVRVCAYAIMADRVHLVLRIDSAAAAALTQEAVARRHARLSPLDHARMQALTRDEIRERMELFRGRLQDIGWFVGSLTEPIARRANQDDGCKGRFWEGRFNPQALLDDAALLTCMSYVDLNPVSAGLAESLEGSDFTSIQQRLRQVARRSAMEKVSEPKKAGSRTAPVVEVGLAGFRADSSAPKKSPPRTAGRASTRGQDARLPVSFHDYLTLVQWAGRQLKAGNRRARSTDLPAPSRALLSKLGLDPDRWLEAVREFGRLFFFCAGSEERIRAHSQRRGIRTARGACRARGFYAGDTTV